jgi:ribonuclease P protein component
MLPKKERLSREEFNQFFSLGKRHHSPTLQIVYAPHDTLHVSVVVSKKIAKMAVTRNKIRRQIYDIVRHHRTEVQLRGVFIFFTKAGVAQMPYSALKEEIQTSIKDVLKKYN